MSREAFLASNREWYKPFGYNPVTTSDARLSYAAPEFHRRDWLLFCSMALAADMTVTAEPELGARGSQPLEVQYSRVFSGPSLAHRACAAFAAAAHGKRFGMLPPCFEFTHADPASGFRHAMQGVEEEYVRACAQYEEDRGETPVHLVDPFRINMMVCGCVSSHCRIACVQITRHASHVTLFTSQLQDVYDVLLLRWSRVQNVYDLAIYQESRDVQRLDEFFETLQWNVCHPDVSAVHLFVEDDGGRTFMQLHMHAPIESPLIDACSKVVFHDIRRTMRYSDAVKLANDIMSGQFVLIMHADVYAGIIFSLSTTSFLLGSKSRMYAPQRRFASQCTLCHV